MLMGRSIAPGSDGRGEVVMAGAHLDSWHGGTGATDNAAGCAIVMEALRYAEGNAAVRPIFEAWLEPLRDLGAGTVTLRAKGDSDHVSFDRAGLPGFQLIQDELDYKTRTHHTNLDVYDRARAGDLRQAAVVLASFLYNAAMRPDLLPRKPLPTASGAGQLP